MSPPGRPKGESLSAQREGSPVSALPAAHEPTPAAAQARLQAVDPAAYARTRNHLDRAVTGLGP